MLKIQVKKYLGEISTQSISTRAKYHAWINACCYFVFSSSMWYENKAVNITLSYQDMLLYNILLLLLLKPLKEILYLY